MLKKLIIGTIWTITLLSACKKKEADPIPESTNMIRVGTIITYKHTDFDDSYGTEIIDTSTITLTMLSEATMGGEKYFYQESKQYGVARNGFIRYASDGMYTFSGRHDMILKLHASVGDTWGDGLSYTRTVKLINQSLTVPKGSYTDVYYLECGGMDQTLTNKMWYNNSDYLLRTEGYRDGTFGPNSKILDYRDELVSIQY